MIDYSTYELTGKEKRDYLVTAAILVSITLYLFYQTPIVILASIPASYFSIPVYIKYKARKRKDLLTVQFRDLLYSLSGSVGAGRHMREALAEAKDNLMLIYEPDTPMLIELEDMVRRFTVSNESDEDLLFDLGRRSGIKDITSFAEIYYICRSAGGDLVKVIGLTSQILIDKLTIIRDIESYTAQKKFEGRIITAMPPAMIFFMDIMSPEYLSPLYHGFTGRMFMTFALGSMIAGYLISEKITDIKLFDEDKDTGKKKSRKDSEGEQGERSRGASGLYKQTHAAFKRWHGHIGRNRKDSV